ncbi:DUF1653 domain-containing protein [Rhodococcus aetherivorans]|uniref:DUF1653 domain-containing protein n=1 Tax=Rhodococcus aetherivorans TaxID=191292 RepID=UPI00294A29E9|nr:DUF1653 domain-containing protein [Rhodococcus aetherivorans]MDV6291468.1 DUF1653 domain-containing protein [Rhodococcus aetherivorans]
MASSMSVDHPITIDYVNHRGERAIRSITPHRVWFGTTEWHPEEQWFLEATDHDRHALRNFALSAIKQWSVEMSGIQAGVYKHFKGGFYLVLGTLRDSETEALLVRYIKLSGDFGEWARPYAMFTETIDVNGETVPRFRRVN